MDEVNDLALSVRSTSSADNTIVSTASRLAASV